MGEEGVRLEIEIPDSMVSYEQAKLLHDMKKATLIVEYADGSGAAIRLDPVRRRRPLDILNLKARK